MKESMYQYLGIPLPKKINVDDIKQEVVESADSTAPILQAIYALDPVTRLPTGDIMCYMSSSTPPELKQFIIDNIMIDTSKHALPSLPDGIDDDTAFALSRDVKESSDAYRARVNNYMLNQVEVRNMAIENAKREQEKFAE